MKLFKCQNCNQLIYFENTSCVRCGHALGYSWQKNELLTLSVGRNGAYMNPNEPSVTYVYCANAAHNACNWIITDDQRGAFCLACELNRTIPDLESTKSLSRWRLTEIAKHRLIYSLLRLSLPVTPKKDNTDSGLAFDFLAPPASTDSEVSKIKTGHAKGLITINIAEADDAYREKIRQSLAEPYRTLLGHFRHEIAHYYWMLFAQSSRWLTRFRTIFGDERNDYGEALAKHYNIPQTDSWREEFISYYAAAHPWEDWAETWAHYLHIVDTLETAYAFGIKIEPIVNADGNTSTSLEFDAYHQQKFDDLIKIWLPITYAVNSLNRAMGQPDLYPFVLPPFVQDKMAFIHGSIRNPPICNLCSS